MKKFIISSILLILFIGCEKAFTSNQFKESIKQKNYEMIITGLKKGHSLNQGDITGMTPLMKGVYHKDQKWISFLLAHKADPNSVDKSGKSALYHAVLSGNIEMVQLLLKSDADPDIKALCEKTPLSLAMSMNQEKIFEALLEYGGDPSNIYYIATGHYKIAIKQYYKPIKIETITDGKKKVVTRMKIKRGELTQKLVKRITTRIAKRRSKMDQNGRRKVTNISKDLNGIILPGGLGDINHGKNFANPVITTEDGKNDDSIMPKGLGEEGDKKVIKPVIHEKR